MLSTTIPNTPSFSSEIVNIKEIQDSINKVHLSNSVEIYVENTNLLIHQYTDISGNMNNLEENLFKNINRNNSTMVLSRYQ